jgi:tetratricopeptide (TPR) repeat protein
LRKFRLSIRPLRALAAGLFVICTISMRPASSAAGQMMRLALSEENLPAAAPSPSATPAAGALPSASGTPASSAWPGQAESSAPASSAAASEVRQPLDLSQVPLSSPPGASSLEALIAQTTDPSLSASLRITEQARQQIGENHYDEAVRTLGHALSIDAGNPYAYFYLGRAYLMKKDYRQALTFFSRAEMGLGSNPPWLGETVGFEGACYEEMSRDQDAALAYQRAVQLTPGNLMARAGYGRMASALPPPPIPPEEQPSAEDAAQPPPEEDEIRTVPEGEPLETAPPAEPAPPPPTAPVASGPPPQ